MEFNEDDIGKRVLLIIDSQKVDEESFESESRYEKIPYEAIKEYKFIQYIKDTSKPAQRIVHSGPKQPKVNPFSLAKRMKADKVRTICDIVEVAEDYLKVEVVKDRRAPWHQSKSRYTK